MSQALTAAEISMVNGIERLNTISHNLANANTAGYKQDIAFSKIFESDLASGVARIQEGAGNVGYKSDYMPSVHKAVDLQSGNLKATGNKLDLAIKGDGYFEVSTPHGVRYTRAGSFSLDGSGHLVNSSGFAVSGVSGEIRLSTVTPTIDRNGNIWDGEDHVGQIKVVKFEDPALLEKKGDGMLAASASAVQPKEQNDYEVYQGYIESSNVNMMSEMVNLIETMRQIEASQKIVSAFDEMMSISLGTIAEV